MINIKDGAKANIVKTTKTFKLVTSCCGVSGALKLRFIVGTVTVSAPKAEAKIKNIKAKYLKKAP